MTQMERLAQFSKQLHEDEPIFPAPVPWPARNTLHFHEQAIPCVLVVRAAQTWPRKRRTRRGARRIWRKHELPFQTHARAQLWGVTGHMWYALRVTLLDYGVVVCNSDQKLDKQHCARCDRPLSVPAVYRDWLWWHKTCYEQGERQLAAANRIIDAVRHMDDVFSPLVFLPRHDSLTPP